MIVRSIDRDVFVLVLVERRHERFEIFFAANLPHVFGREVAMEPGTGPIAHDWLTMQLNFHPISFAETRQEKSSYPHLICGGIRRFFTTPAVPFAVCPAHSSA